MRFIKSIMIVAISALIALTAGCSSDASSPFFQNNHTSADPSGGGLNPFSGLPNLDDLTDFAGEAVAAIAEAFNAGDFNLSMDPTEYRTFVDNIKEIVDNPGDVIGDSDANKYRRTAAFDVLTEVIPGLADDYGTGHGAYGLLAALRNIVGYIIDQESLDDTSGNYIDELYTYLEKINDADLDMKHDVYQFLLKTIDYIDDTYVAADKETIMADMRTFLMDSSGETFTSLLLNMQEAMGKILMRADSTITFTDPLLGGTSTGLGNSVAGVDYLMTGINSMISTSNAYDGGAARTDLYNLLRVVGEMLYKLKGAGPTYYPTLKYLLTNIEDYYTVSGTNFTGDYNHAMAGSPAYYSNAELYNTLKEMWPSIAKLFIRERSDSSGNSDYGLVRQSSTGGTQSPIEMLARNLYQLKVSGVDYSTSGNELEPSLANMVKYNAYGTLRSSGSSYNVSLLDHTAFTMAAGYSFGYLTRVTNGTASGEPYNNKPSSGESTSYQHGVSTKGVLTINDTMYSWTSGGLNVRNVLLVVTTLDVWTDCYNLSLAQRYSWDDGAGAHDGQGKYVWRSNSAFTPVGGPSEIDGNDPAGDNLYEYYQGSDFPAQCLLGPSAAGDIGIPNGGRPVHNNTDSLRPNSNSATITAPGASFDRNDYRTYYPKVADGKGCLNTAAWMFNWISRSCWDGAGPYYSKGTGDLVASSSLSPTPAWTGHTSGFYVAFKPNGEVYAYVDKNTTPWTYFYPSKLSGNCRNRDGVTVSNDVADPDDTSYGTDYQRFNRYRDIYKSDYYAVQGGHEHNSSSTMGSIGISPSNGYSFCVPPMNPNGASYNDSGRGLFYLASGSHSAQQFWTYEKVQEWTNTDVTTAPGNSTGYSIVGNANRECATQEEAIFRNYQWLLYEKKFMFIIPQCLYTAWMTAVGAPAYLDSGAYVVLEANGLVGLSNLKKGTSNGYWNLLGGTGAATNQDGTGTTTATTLTVGSSIWTANYFTNWYVSINGGTPLRITGNTATQITFTPSTSDIGSGRSYRIFPRNATISTNYRNYPDYGNSYMPGDSRVMTFAAYYKASAPGTTTNGTIDPEVLYDLFGSGHVLPDVIGGNIAPVQRLGFIDQSGYIGSVPVSATASPTGRGFLTTDVCYTGDTTHISRNKVLPLFVALAGALSDGTYYEAASSGYNYNYTSTKHKYPILDFLEGIMIPLSKPLVRLYNDTTSYTSPDGTITNTIGYRWVPRLYTESTVTAPYYYFTPSTTSPYTTWDSFRPLNTLYPLGKFIADQNVGSTYNDGLIPTLASNNVYLVTKLLGLVQRMGNTSTSSPYYDGASPDGGVLENVSKGLEQIVTSLQVARGNNYANSYSWIDSGRYDQRLNSNRYGWMYSDVASRVTGTPAPISVDLNKGLDLLIGHTNLTGISKFIDDHPVGATWNNYDRLLNAVGEMMGNSSGSYYIMGNETTDGTLVHILNNMLTAAQMTSDDRKALRHTVGVLMDRYQNSKWVTHAATGTSTSNVTATSLVDTTKSWTANEHVGKVVIINGIDNLYITANTTNTLTFSGATQTGALRSYDIYDSDLYRILRTYLPESMTSMTGHYQNLITMLKSLMDKDVDGTMDAEINDYLVDLLIHGDTAEEVIPEMYDLLSNGSMWDSAYYNSSYPNKATLKELVDICSELSLEIDDL